MYTTIALMPFFLLSYVPFATDHWLPRLFTTVYAIYWLWDLTASRRGRNKVLQIGAWNKKIISRTDVKRILLASFSV